MSLENEKIYPKSINTSLAHKLYSLVKASVLFYGVVFIFLFASDFWFGADLFMLSFLLAPLILGLSHLFLCFQESSFGCHFFSPIFFDRPIVPYKHWLETCLSGNEQNEKYVCVEGLLVGNQMVPFETIDALELTFWGNLVFRTNTIAAPIFKNERIQSEGQTIFKLPASACGPQKQKEFLKQLLEKCPQIKLNKRLSNLVSRQENLSKKGKAGIFLFKVEEYVPLFGACVFILIFLDFTISTCLYLDTHKHFFISQYKARHKEPDLAKAEYEKGESMRLSATSFIMSPVKNALFQTGAAASRLWQARAEALWYLGKRAEAIESLAKAVTFMPTNYKINLEMARWLCREGKNKEGRAYLLSAIESNSDSMLLKLLVLNELYADKKKDQAKKLEKIYLENLDDDLFGDEPVWPPGGNRVVKEGWVRDDIEHILSELKKGFWSH